MNTPLSGYMSEESIALPFYALIASLSLAFLSIVLDVASAET
jgi:hypothetical protein